MLLLTSVSQPETELVLANTDFREVPLSDMLLLRDFGVSGAMSLAFADRATQRITLCESCCSRGANARHEGRPINAGS